MSGQIFISYRRDDASHPAGRLYDRLAQKFPKSRIFMDIDNLDPGEDFAEAINISVGSCDVLIAVIGRHWLDARDPDGNLRLDNPDDFVRLEVSTALKRGIRVIPVLVDGALMPRSTQLPPDLQPIVRRQAVEVTHNRFASDSERVVNAVDRAIERAAAEEQEREKTRLDAESREREEQQRREAERLEARRIENERLANEQREKERLEAERRQTEAKERREAERRQRESTSDDKTIAPSPPHSQDSKPVQGETSPIVESKGSTKQKPPAYAVPLVVVSLVALLLIGGLWFAGREAALVTPTPTTNAQAKSYEDWGSLQYKKGDYNMAIWDYTGAITADPKDGAAYQGRGLAYQKLGRNDEAQADFAKAKQLGYTGSQ